MANEVSARLIFLGYALRANTFAALLTSAIDTKREYMASFVITRFKMPDITEKKTTKAQMLSVFEAAFFTDAVKSYPVLNSRTSYATVHRLPIPIINPDKTEAVNIEK